MAARSSLIAPSIPTASAGLTMSNQPYSSASSEPGSALVPFASSPETAAPEEPQSALYGSFFIDKTEIAIPITQIQEVVNFPATITPVPLSPPALQGVFNLRGTVIPILNLRAIFQMAECQDASTQKIAIMDMDGVRIGLIFDRTSEILRVDQENITTFSRDRSHHLLRGVIRFEDENRILQVLDCQQVLELDYLPRITAQAQRQQHYKRRSSDQRRQCIAFSIGEVMMAFDIAVVNEIIRIEEVQQSVLSSSICLGMINLRGRVIPIVDFAKAMKMPSSADAASRIDEKCVIIIHYEDAYFGLVVDEIHTITTFYNNELLPMSMDFHALGRVFQGVVSHAEKDDVLLLDHDVLFAMQALRELYHGHQKLYAESQNAAAAKARGEKRTYITFTLNEHFGLPITAISEIVSYTAELMHPPGMPGIIEGLMHLRGEMIPIVNMRHFYKETDYPSRASSKIIILSQQGQKFGLLVDSVDNIVSYYSNEPLKLPPMMYARHSNNHDDIDDAVRLDNNGTTTDYMMLNVETLCRRILAEM
jgi:purine-binding chemotaxis protein CheW